MSSFVIEGGYPLSGEITPQGAKNEVLQIICATLLTEEEVQVKNVPDILDVNNLIELLREMGVTVRILGKANYSFQAKDVNISYLHSQEFVDKLLTMQITDVYIFGLERIVGLT